MHDTGRVRRDQDRGDLPGDAHRLVVIEPGLDRRPQALALDQLEHQPVAIMVGDVVVDPADVRVVELRENLRLAQEPGLGVRGDAVSS